MSRHAQQAVRPRYGRIAALGTSVTITAVAVLGGTGMLPSAATTRTPKAPAAIEQVAAQQPRPATQRPDRAGDRAADGPAAQPRRPAQRHAGAGPRQRRRARVPHP